MVNDKSLPCIAVHRRALAFLRVSAGCVVMASFSSASLGLMMGGLPKRQKMTVGTSDNT